MGVWGGGGDGEQGGVGVWGRRLVVDGIGEEGVECELGSEGVGGDVWMVEDVCCGWTSEKNR